MAYGIGESGELLASTDSPLAEVPSCAWHAGLDVFASGQPVQK